MVLHSSQRYFTSLWQLFFLFCRRLSPGFHLLKSSYRFWAKKLLLCLTRHLRWNISTFSVMFISWYCPYLACRDWSFGLVGKSEYISFSRRVRCKFEKIGSQKNKKSRVHINWWIQGQLSPAACRYIIAIESSIAETQPGIWCLLNTWRKLIGLFNPGGALWEQRISLTAFFCVSLQNPRILNRHRLLLRPSLLRRPLPPSPLPARSQSQLNFSTTQSQRPS